MHEHFLAIQTAFPGDAILTLPALQKLKEKFPNSEIDVVAIPSTKDIFNSSPVVSNVIVLEKRGKHKSLVSIIKLSHELKKSKYQKIYSFHRSLRTSLLVYFIKSYSVGFNTAVASFLYNKKVIYNSSDHEVKRNLSIINEDNWNGKWEFLPKINNIKIDDNVPINAIAIAPGSVWETKKVPKQKFIEIIEELINNNKSLVLIGGKEDITLCNEIASNFKENVVSIAGSYSIPESIHVLKKCSLLISNDSAPTHMGMCADIPVITLYCSTVPEFGFYPYSKKSKSIGVENLDCKPCGIHGHNECPKNHFKCGNDLHVNKIVNAALKMLD